MANQQTASKKEAPPPKRKAPIQRPLAERLRIARQINEYRAAHPRMQLTDVFLAMGLSDTVKQAAYWTWRKRLELNDLTRKANRKHAETPETAETEEAQHFPLAAIPDKPQRTAVTRRVNGSSQRDEDRVLAASLLEIAARLLKR